jgi:hypothetical protein
MSDLFKRYKQNPDWTVVRGLPDNGSVRLVLLCASCFSEAYNIQPRLGEPVMDAAFHNLHTPEGTEEAS